MRKNLIIFGVLFAIIFLPILSMAISPTRDLLLNLVPEEQILKLADIIDQNRVSNELKIQELEAVVTSQQKIIDTQASEFANQKASIESTNQTIQSVQSRVTDESECRKLYSENPECKPENKIYSSKSEFDKFIAETKKRIDQGSGESIDEYKAKFSKCQNIIAKCE